MISNWRMPDLIDHLDWANDMELQLDAGTISTQSLSILQRSFPFLFKDQVEYETVMIQKKVWIPKKVPEVHVQFSQEEEKFYLGAKKKVKLFFDEGAIVSYHEMWDKILVNQLLSTTKEKDIDVVEFCLRFLILSAFRDY